MSRFLLLACTAALLSGCLTPGAITPTMRYTVEPTPELARVAPGTLTLGIRPLAVARPYDLTMVVYHGGGMPLEYKRHAEWAERPEDVVTRAITDAIASAGRFADVGDAALMGPPDYILTGEVRRYRENRAGAVPVAELELRLELRRAMKSGAPWAKTLRQAVPLEGDSASALAAAMTIAIETIAERAAAEIVGLNLGDKQEGA